MRSLLAIAGVASLSIFVGSVAHADKKESKPIAQETFEHGIDRWEYADPSAWQIEKSGTSQVLALTKKKSKYEPPFRSPYNKALLKGVEVTDFELNVRLKSTEPDYGHRSLCLFFGYQDQAHFYYVHFGKQMDDHANQIFIVNEAARTKISTTTTKGTPWDDAWHKARISRDAESGAIAVYFDDMQKPIMTATDKTFTWGLAGVGSFDDRGQFDDFVLLGAERKE